MGISMQSSCTEDCIGWLMMAHIQEHYHTCRTTSSSRLFRYGLCLPPFYCRSTSRVIFLPTAIPKTRKRQRRREGDSHIWPSPLPTSPHWAKLSGNRLEADRGHPSSWLRLILTQPTIKRWHNGSVVEVLVCSVNQPHKVRKEALMEGSWSSIQPICTFTNYTNR